MRHYIAIKFTYRGEGVDIQKLQALAVIQEAGSFSRAAETLGYSQAGLTYMMNSLENEVGLRLLDRSYSGVRLSENHV